MNERMLAFKLNKWESKATQLIGEAVDYKERLAEIEKRGMNQDAEAKLIQKGLDLVRAVLEELWAQSMQSWWKSTGKK